MLTVKLGRPMTKKQAGETLCPILMQEQDIYNKCYGDACMWWMWVDEIPTGSEHGDVMELLSRQNAIRERIGFCCK